MICVMLQFSKSCEKGAFEFGSMFLWWRIAKNTTFRYPFPTGFHKISSSFKHSCFSCKVLGRKMEIKSQKTLQSKIGPKTFLKQEKIIFCHSYEEIWVFSVFILKIWDLGTIFVIKDLWPLLKHKKNLKRLTSESSPLAFATWTTDRKHCMETKKGGTFPNSDWSRMFVFNKSVPILSPIIMEVEINLNERKLILEIHPFSTSMIYGRNSVCFYNLPWLFINTRPSISISQFFPRCPVKRLRLRPFHQAWPSGKHLLPSAPWKHSSISMKAVINPHVNLLWASWISGYPPEERIHIPHLMAFWIDDVPNFPRWDMLIPCQGYRISALVIPSYHIQIYLRDKNNDVPHGSAMISLRTLPREIGTSPDVTSWPQEPILKI